MKKRKEMWVEGEEVLEDGVVEIGMVKGKGREGKKRREGFMVG